MVRRTCVRLSSCCSASTCVRIAGQGSHAGATDCSQSARPSASRRARGGLPASASSTVAHSERYVPPLASLDKSSQNWASKEPSPASVRAHSSSTSLMASIFAEAATSSNAVSRSTCSVADIAGGENAISCRCKRSSSGPIGNVLLSRSCSSEAMSSSTIPTCKHLSRAGTAIVRSFTSLAMAAIVARRRACSSVTSRLHVDSIDMGSNSAKAAALPARVGAVVKRALRRTTKASAAQVAAACGVDASVRASS
mmetsp:Transcript_45900/g.127374  ORF Transcript_45900/g.127374 Transcript_45900/m.127374 type:complete len:253 (+) Transcript_45900:1374-2132(+)